MPKKNKGALEAAIDAAAAPPAPVTQFTAHQLAWASFEAAIAAALGEVEAFVAEADKISRAVDEAEARIRAAKIYPGPALLADLMPAICESLMERTGKVWNFMHMPTKPMARLWAAGDGPTFEVSVDDMIRPRYARVHTLWSATGKTAWGDTCFAACLVHSKAEDPYAKILVSRGADAIARLIAADIEPRAETFWPQVREALGREQLSKERHEAWVATIAEALGDPHVKLTPDGDFSLHFGTKNAPRVAWHLDVNRHGDAVFSGSAQDVDVNHPLIAGLIAMQARQEPTPLALAAE